MEEETETEAPATEESEDGEDDFGGFDFTSKYILIESWNNRKSGSPVFSQWKQGTSLVSKGGFRKWDYLTKRIVISAVIK